MSDLKAEVQKARKVLETHAMEISQNLFGNFPRGCCDNTSQLLAHWLYYCGFEDIKVILGKRDDGTNHSWLLVENLIVDITADQFDDGDFGVFPQTNRFHSDFRHQKNGVYLIDGVLVYPANKFINYMQNS